LDFLPAEAVGAFTVFHVAGHKYRLITVIQYRRQVVYSRAILTQEECRPGEVETMSRATIDERKYAGGGGTHGGAGLSGP
jgi:hypothetical protein